MIASFETGKKFWLKNQQSVTCTFRINLSRMNCYNFVKKRFTDRFTDTSNFEEK